VNVIEVESVDSVGIYTGDGVDSEVVGAAKVTEVSMTYCRVPSLFVFIYRTIKEQVLPCIGGMKTITCKIIFSVNFNGYCLKITFACTMSFETLDDLTFF
jgi:hypothetical protein